ncbi:hypothetical protein Glove_183g62 [Diversispora epigaea]|nr:hypothetical protein Glove_183g62 [Diversispora epigaea]
MDRQGQCSIGTIKKKAFKWYLKSAEGVLEITKDEKRAFKWYLKYSEERKILYQLIINSN